jgi:hypothetical protein
VWVRVGGDVRARLPHDRQVGSVLVTVGLCCCCCWRLPLMRAGTSKLRITLGAAFVVAILQDDVHLGHCCWLPGTWQDSGDGQRRRV